jgi:hypothetical protein
VSHPTYWSDGACTQGEHATSIPIGLTGALCASPPDFVRKNGEPRWFCGAAIQNVRWWWHETTSRTCGNLVTAPGRRCPQHGGQRDEVSGVRNDRARIRRLERERRTVQRKRIAAGLPPDAAPPMGPVVMTWQDAAVIAWWLDHGGLAALVGE